MGPASPPNPANCSTRMEAKGSRSLTWHLWAVLATSQLKCTSSPLAGNFQQHTSYLWLLGCEQDSTVLSRWILMPSPQEEVTDLLKSKISCLLSQWCVKWLRQKQAVLPLMGKQGCHLWSKHQHLLGRDWRRDKESFSVLFALSGGHHVGTSLPS